MCAGGRCAAGRRSGCRSAGPGPHPASWPAIGRSCSAANQPGSGHGHRVVRGRRARRGRAGGRTARRGRCTRSSAARRVVAPPVPRKAATSAITSPPAARATTRRRRRRPGCRALGVGRRPAVRGDRGRARAVDEPQQRVHAVVDQEDAQERHGERDDRVAREEHDHPGRDEGDARAGRAAAASAARRSRAPRGGAAARRRPSAAGPTSRRRRRSRRTPRGSTPADRRSPRKASQIAPAAARASAPSTCRTATERAMPSSTTTAMPAHAAPTPSSATVRRRSGDDQSAAATRARQRSGRTIARTRSARAASATDAPSVRRVPFEDLDPVGRPHLPRDRRLELLERGRQHGADVGDRQRDRVLVAVEDGAVDVTDAGAEEARERAAADDPRHRGLDQRARREEVGLPPEHDLVRDALGDHACARCRRAARRWRGWRTGRSRRSCGGRSRRRGRTP